MTPARFASALSTQPEPARAEGEALEQLAAGLAGAAPDLLVVFATHEHVETLAELGPRLAEATRARHVVGCTAQAVLADAREAEGEPGLALWAAKLPETSVEPFRLGAVPGPEDEVLFTGMPDFGSAGETSALIFGDPFSFPVDAFLARLNGEHPGVPIVGGLASGAQRPGQGALIGDEGIVHEGAVGVVLRGAMGIQPVVSQGCRPVGRPWVITACHENLIQKLGGRPAVDVLMETLGELPPEERHLLQRAPFVGLALDPKKSEFDRGDFLVRGLMGIQPKERAIAVGDQVRRGQTVQFLVRDAVSAGEDLRHLLARAGAVDEPQGALLFSCNGRGKRMFGVADHDATSVHASLGVGTPVAGFFAAGEIGPVDGQNFLHGFTASVALFRRRAPAQP